MTKPSSDWERRLENWIETQHGTAGWQMKLENFIRQIAAEERQAGAEEEREEFDKFLWENGITHKECAQKLQHFIRSRTPKKP